MDDSFLDLYSPDDMVAKARADAMERRARGLQGAGLIISTLTGKRDPTNGALGEIGTRDLGQVVQAAQHRPAMLMQAEQMRKTRLQNEAESSPEYAGAMRGLGYELGAPPGSLENVPGQALEHVVGPYEKLAGHRLQAQLFGAKQSLMGWQLKTLDSGRQVWVNTHTLETREVTPGGGAGRVITAGRGIPSLAGPAPIAAPAASPDQPAAAPAKPGPLRAPATPKPEGPLGAPSSTTFQPLFGTKLDKANKDFGRDIDPNIGGGEIQRNQSRLNAAIRLRKLVTNEDGSIKTMIPPQFMKETATALAQLVANGGQPAQNLIEELTPKTKSSKIADWVQWMTDNPQDAGQQGFVKLYLESANREAQAAQEALNKAISGRAGKHQRLIKGNPDVARETAAQFGWNIDDKGRLVPLQSAAVASGGEGAPTQRPDAPVQLTDPAREYAALPPGTLYLLPGETKPRRKR